MQTVKNSIISFFYPEKFLRPPFAIVSRKLRAILESVGFLSLTRTTRTSTFTLSPPFTRLHKNGYFFNKYPKETRNLKG